MCSDSRSEEFWYDEVGIDRVPDETYFKARSMLRFVESDLDLKDLTIRWFLPIPREVGRMEMILVRLSRACGERKKPTVFSENKEILGHVRPLGDNAEVAEYGVIWIRANLSPQETAKAVAHEARHVWQLKRYRPFVTKEESDAGEADAWSYHKKVMEEFQNDF